MLILLHKGKGGGLSDMFGGGMSSSLGGSSVAERNLDRITISVAVVWFTCIVGLSGSSTDSPEPSRPAPPRDRLL